MYETAKKKGINILGTGDITQPAWRKNAEEQLQFTDSCYAYRDLFFIPQTELEDAESIHHLVLLPDLHAGEVLQERLTPFVKNIDGRWAGRPHVNKTPAEIVELVESVGGISGPAHAFTPFKSIFRQGKFSSLSEAYGTAVKKVKFLELGLSADSSMADRIQSLQEVTFLSNSDAHSQGIQSLGREFNRISMETPSFDDLRLALERRQNRKIILNVGLDPRLGKYYIMFCKKCRRRVLRQIQASSNIFGWGSVKIDSDFIQYGFPNLEREREFLVQVSKGKIDCAACKAEMGKDQTKKSTISKLFLGVSERINEIATWLDPHPPEHRPPYLDTVPLIEVLRAITGTKGKITASLEKKYDLLVQNAGTEYHILIDLPIDQLEQYENGKIAIIIDAFRKHAINYIPGGGGTFGEIVIEEMD
jgi:PHP family Zn ribbon phosphoesterase